MKKIVISFCLLLCLSARCMEEVTESIDVEIPSFSYIPFTESVQLPNGKHLTFEPHDETYLGASIENQSPYFVTLHDSSPTGNIAFGKFRAKGEQEFSTDSKSPIRGLAISPNQEAIALCRENGFCAIFSTTEKKGRERQIAKNEPLLAIYFDTPNSVICLTTQSLFAWNFSTNQMAKAPLRVGQQRPLQTNTYIAVPVDKQTVLKKPSKPIQNPQSPESSSLRNRVSSFLFGKK